MPLTLPSASAIAPEGTATTTTSAAEPSPPSRPSGFTGVAGLLPRLREPAAHVAPPDDRDVHRVLPGRLVFYASRSGRRLPHNPRARGPDAGRPPRQAQPPGRGADPRQARVPEPGRVREGSDR